MPILYPVPTSPSPLSPQLWEEKQAFCRKDASSAHWCKSEYNSRKRASQRGCGWGFSRDPDPPSTPGKALLHHFKGIAVKVLLAAIDAARESNSSFGPGSKRENSEWRVRRHFPIQTEVRKQNRPTDSIILFSRGGIIMLVLCLMNSSVESCSG